MSERPEVLKLLQAAAVQVLGADAPRLSEDLVLSEANIDSLDLVEMIMVVEDVEGFFVDAADLAPASLVSDLIDMVLAKRGSCP